MRIVVLSRYADAIRDAEQAFQKRYGKGLIEVETGETSVARETAGCQRGGGIALGIPGDNAQRHWRVTHGSAFQRRAEQDWTYGGAENLSAFLAMLYRSAGILFYSNSYKFRDLAPTTTPAPGGPERPQPDRSGVSLA